MHFTDAEVRVPSKKPPLRFVPEESDLNESNKVELTLRDDVKAFLDGRSDPKKKTPLGTGTHEVEVRQFSGMTIEDLMLWASTMMSALT